MGKRLIFQTPEQRMQDLIKVRMKLGVYAKDGFGYVKLEETKNGDFTVQAHLKGKLITNPAKICETSVILRKRRLPFLSPI